MSSDGNPIPAREGLDEVEDRAECEKNWLSIDDAFELLRLVSSPEIGVRPRRSRSLQWPPKVVRNSMVLGDSLHRSHLITLLGRVWLNDSLLGPGTGCFKSEDTHIIAHLAIKILSHTGMWLKD